MDAQQLQSLGFSRSKVDGGYHRVIDPRSDYPVTLHVDTEGAWSLEQDSVHGESQEIYADGIIRTPADLLGLLNLLGVV